MFWRSAIKLTLAGALVLAGLALFAYSQWGGLGPAPAEAQGNHPAGAYTIVLNCEDYNVVNTSGKFTKDGGDVTTWPSPSGPSCQPGGIDTVMVEVSGEWNDWEFVYKCPSGNTANTLQISAGNVHLRKNYTLQCPSDGTTHGPAGDDPPGDATVAIHDRDAVGGIAELPDVAASSPEAADSSGGSSSPPYAAIAGVAAAAAVLLAVSGWYARRRLS